MVWRKGVHFLKLQCSEVLTWHFYKRDKSKNVRKLWSPLLFELLSLLIKIFLVLNILLQPCLPVFVCCPLDISVFSYLPYFSSQFCRLEISFFPFLPQTSSSVVLPHQFLSFVYYSRLWCATCCKYVKAFYKLWSATQTYLFSLPLNCKLIEDWQWAFFIFACIRLLSIVSCTYLIFIKVWII